MRIWHDGAAIPGLELNGVNAAVWLLAREQAKFGHEVTLLVTQQPDAAGLAQAAAASISLVYIPASKSKLPVHSLELDAALDRQPPDILHMHSVFVPRQANLAAELKRRNIPYIISPHGGYAAAVLRRNATAKKVYRRLFEFRRCKDAAAIAVAVGEAPEVRRFLRGQGNVVEQMPIAVDVPAFAGHRWKGNSDAKRFVFMGRFDVYVKGLDRLIELAGLMRDYTFHLYGSTDPKTQESLAAMRLNLIPNVFFHPPLFGREKIDALCDATAYLQLSRSESFGISIAEAMTLGVPCAIAEEIHMAELFRNEDLGLSLPPSAGLAARKLTDALDTEGQMQHWSQRASDYARAAFDPTKVAQRYLNLYEEVLAPLQCTTTSR